MKRGWLILAHRNDVYLQFAGNLAASLKIHSRYPVALLTDAQQLPAPSERFYDEVIQLRPEHNIPFYAKTLLNRYTPFEDTIFLDADSIAVSDEVDLLFDDPQEIDIHAIDHYRKGDDCGMAWADLPGLYDFYGWEDQVFTETNSSYIRWNSNSRLARRIWDLAERLYAEHFYPKYNEGAFPFYPDELAFNSALAFAGHKAEKGGPLLIHFREDAKPDLDILNSKPIISLPGVTNTHPHVWNWYFRTIGLHFAKHFGWTGFRPKKENKSSNIAHRGPRWIGLRDFDKEAFNELLDGTRTTEKDH